MANASLVIGIDAGGTATKVAVARGAHRTSIAGGAGNLLTLGDAGFLRLLRQCARHVADATGAPPRRVSAVCIGGAGLGRERERDKAVSHLRSVWPRARVSATDDATIFLWAVFGAQPGAVLMAGTGSLCTGRNARGECARAGGWGSLLGDPGSAFAMGREALVHALAAGDGQTETTPFSSTLLKHLKLTDALSVLSLVYDPDDGGPAAVASLAPFVLDRARRGDPVAREIVATQAASLASLGAAAVTRLGSSVNQIALGGGLFRTKLYAAAVRSELERRCPTIRTRVSRKEPVLGAVRCAQELLNDG